MNKLLISDTPEKYTELAVQLKAQNWNLQFSSFAEALSRSREIHRDIVLLDMSNGIETCVDTLKSMRAIGVMTPIICIGIDDMTRKLAAFEAGADDYICSPVDQKELLSCTRNLLEKSEVLSDYQRLTVESVTVDTRLRILWKQEKKAKLSESESLIISFLFAHPKKTFTAPVLFEKLWLDKESSSEATIRVHINSLRKKLSELGAENVIRNVRGRGYMVYG